jgi:hypothetical protein
MLRLMKVAPMPHDDAVTPIEDAVAVRWLVRTLEPARARVAAGPSPEAVERIRASVFGDTLPRRKARRLAA